MDNEQPGDAGRTPATPLRDEHFNPLSYNEYLRQRDPAFDDVPLPSRRSMPLVPAEGPGRRTVRSYELHRRGVHDLGAGLVPLVSLAKDLVQLFNGAWNLFGLFFNSPPSPHRAEVSANHPREQSHRMLDDLWHTEADMNGMVGLIENQTLEDLFLDDWCHWYGWSSVAKVPQIIRVYETRLFDCVYGGGPFWNTAALCFRYRVGETGWYAYYAAYTYRFYTNYAYVILSRDGTIPWDTLYDALTSNSSISEPKDCPYKMAAIINLAARARTGCQIDQKQSWVTSINNLLAPWRTREGYRDEL